MRLGVSYGMNAKTPEEWVSELLKIRARAVSFPVDYHADLKTIDAYAQAAKENDIVIAEVGAWVNPMHKDPATREAAVERCIEQLKLADYIGANCACNITGSAGPIWDYYYPENYDEAFYDDMIRTHRTIIEKADTKKAKYSVEPMPWMVPSGPDEYLKFIRDVGYEEKLGVHIDMVNWMNGFDRIHNQRAFMDEVFEKLHGRIDSCHFKDFRLLTELTFQVKETPIGTGMFDYKYYVQKIEEEDPELPLLIEHLPGKQDYIDSITFVQKELGL